MPVHRSRPPPAHLVVAAFVLSLVAAGLSAAPARAAAPLSIAVNGNHLLDGNGNTVVLRGVSRSDPVYPCIQGWGLWDGPSDAASAAAIAGWYTNAVRLQLNEDCWLNINGVNAAYGGAAYQNAISGYVNLLHQQGLYVILSLAWNAPGATPSTTQQVMADADHAPAFWQSVAAAFKSDPAVLFELYNEPHDISWDCWLNGCLAPGGWQTAGMQSLVNTVRGAGATQPLLLGGLGYGADLTGWLQYRPSDPQNALVAAFHLYDIGRCTTLSCWTTYVTPLAQRVPVVTSELGESDCRHAFIDPFMAWADLSGVSYLGFAWNTWANQCASGPTLITAWDGTPTSFGVGLRDHLATLARGLSISVSGTRLIDGNAKPITLHGVGRMGALFPCIQGWGIFDGPTDAGSVAAIASWHTNAVRLQLNEDCWLNINGVNPAFAGANYQNAIVNYVNLLHRGGLYVILALTWNAPGSTPSQDQQVMADADHAPGFWQSVATTFRQDPAVLFDLYSKPHDISWDCWRDGCLTAGGWQAAGMQSLVTAVRGTGATQPVLVAGLGWGNDLSGWLQFRPVDPANALLASFHEYDGSGCGTAACWSSTVQPVTAQVPVVTAELGERDCAHGFIDPYMSWADPRGVSYLGFTWEAWANRCATGPTLVTSYDGTPTNFGIGLRDHLDALARS